MRRQNHALYTAVLLRRQEIRARRAPDGGLRTPVRRLKCLKTRATAPSSRTCLSKREGEAPVCGIMGYVGLKPAAPLLLEGLSRLEYRGYDSAGIATLDDAGDLHVTKCVGKLNGLALSLEGRLPAGNVGIGHTRWATHGRPSQDNAHPQQDCAGAIVVIHNGIVENYLTLKRDLQGAGHRFVSETDTEVIPHLIEADRK